tara:strand:+ start:27 stop:152 length:126 start_codon:yes stop_codon:yes gene_type:complete
MHGADEAAGIFVLAILGWATALYAGAYMYAAYRDWKDGHKW